MQNYGALHLNGKCIIWIYTFILSLFVYLIYIAIRLTKHMTLSDVHQS